MDYKTLDIHQIWTLSLKGDDHALAELMNRFEPAIRSESTMNGQINEDVSQEIREKFINAIQSLRKSIDF